MTHYSRERQPKKKEGKEEGISSPFKLQTGLAEGERPSTGTRAKKRLGKAKNRYAVQSLLAVTHRHRLTAEHRQKGNPVGLLCFQIIAGHTDGLGVGEHRVTSSAQGGGGKAEDVCVQLQFSATA